MTAYLFVCVALRQVNPFFAPVRTDTCLTCSTVAKTLSLMMCYLGMLLAVNKIIGVKLAHGCGLSMHFELLLCGSSRGYWTIPLIQIEATLLVHVAPLE